MHIKRSRFSWCLFSSVLLLSLTSCANLNKDKDTSLTASAMEQQILDEIDALVDGKMTNTNPEKGKIPATVLPTMPLVDTKVDSKALEERFDINVADVEVRDFLLGMVADSDRNIVMHPEVSGRVSLSLKKVTINETLQVLRDVYGYEFQTTTNGFFVQPIQLRTKVYIVNYINLDRRGSSQTTISSGQLAGSSESAENSDGGSSKSGGSVVGSVVNTSSETNIWREIEDTVRSIIGGGEGRSVVISPQSGMVIVKAMPNELREVESVLRVLQKNLQRQVVIEAKIIEVELSDNFQSGINWSLLSQNGSRSHLFSQTGGGTILNNQSSLNTGQGNLNPSNPTQPVTTAIKGFGGIFSAALSNNDFTAFIELLKQQGNVKVLSSPRVSTVNNQKAVIKVGKDEFFVTEVKGSNVSGTNNTATAIPEIQLTPFFSGIALDVTPQIDSTNNVTLHIHPTVSRIQDQVKTVTVNNQDQTIPVALSNVRESDSIVRAASGQLIVIGGLMQTSTSDSNANVPILGDLPVLKEIFGHKKRVGTKTEMVILLRPIVINDDQQWQQQISTSMSQISP